MDDTDLDTLSFPEFKELDSVLRCGICHEIIQTPVITSCSHTFCSLCVRKWLSTKQVCPSCSDTVYESSLRKNPIVQNMVDALRNLQKHKNNRKPVSHEQDTSLSVSQSSIQVKSFAKISNGSSCNGPVTGDSDTSEEAFVPRNKKTPPKTPKQNRKEKPTPLSSNASQTPKGTQSTRAIASSFTPKTPQREGKAPALSSSTPQTPRNQSAVSSSSHAVPQASTPGAQKVPCPVCARMVSESLINVHLDRCLVGDSTRSSSVEIAPSTSKVSSLSHSPGISKLEQKNIKKSLSGSTSKQPLQPIKKMVYNLFKDAQLKKELKKHGLSTNGDRNTLVSRLNRYVVMHNAECDSTNPRSLDELRKAFDKEDRALVAPPNNTFSQLFKTKQPDPEEFEIHRKSYLNQNKSSFDSLIQNLRRRETQKKKPQTRLDSETEGEDDPPPPSNFVPKRDVRRSPDKTVTVLSSDSDGENSRKSNTDSSDAPYAKAAPSVTCQVIDSSSEEDASSHSVHSAKFKKGGASVLDEIEADLEKKNQRQTKESYSDSDDSDLIDCIPLKSKIKSSNVKRKVSCIESDDDSESTLQGLPEKRTSLEGRSPVLSRKVPVKRELRNRSSQNQRVVSPDAPPARRSQRNVNRRGDDGKNLEACSSSDLFASQPPSPASSDIPCGQNTFNDQNHDDNDDALSQLVSLMSDNDSGSSTDFEK